MTNITLVVPAELKHRMDIFPEINWSEVARQAFMQKIKDMEFLKEFKSQSKISEEDALRLGKEVKKNLAKKIKGE